MSIKRKAQPVAEKQELMLTPRNSSVWQERESVIRRLMNKRERLEREADAQDGINLVQPTVAGDD